MTATSTCASSENLAETGRGEAVVSQNNGIRCPAECHQTPVSGAEDGLAGRRGLPLSDPSSVLTNGEQPAVRISDVQQLRSPTARIARTIDGHALSPRNHVEVR